MRTLSISFLLFASLNPLTAYEAMHEKTPVGEIMALDLPKRVALEAKTSGPYFQSDNGLFRKLFRFISKNDISMTTPVEADINPGKMRFFVGNKDMAKQIASTQDVEVITLDARKVVSIGARGSYSMKRFEQNKEKLLQWVAKQTKYEVIGEAYAVYWDGPFVLGFFKRSEVHLPVKLRKQTAK